MKKKAISAAKSFIGLDSKRSKGSLPTQRQVTPSASVPDSSEPGPSRHPAPETEVPSFSPHTPPLAAQPTTVQANSSTSETDLNSDFVIRPSRFSRSELEDAINTFKSNYSQFAKKNQKYILLDDQLEIAFPEQMTPSDVQCTARIFSDNIRKTLHVSERKKILTEAKWTSEVGQFFTKLYPVARLSCGLTAAVGEGASFAPLKGAASGLGLILQILDDEAGRADDFRLQLRYIESQAALIADNPKYDLNLDVTQNLLMEKSIDLLSAIIKFFNSALLYLSGGFFVNLLKTAITGPEAYKAGKEQLKNAILQYDQAVMHLTAHIVAGMKYRQDRPPNAEFLDWLSPSYWLVESQFSSLRNQRTPGTLEWARDMPEFQAWRLSDLSESSEARITWIKGTLGVGKSIMAAYFIDLLKCQYPNAIIAYFFCRSNQPGLTNARDILRTLAYQCIENDKDARAVLENLKSKGFRITNDLCIEFLFEKLLLEPLRNSPPIYIVLDGLDEADLDVADAQKRPELHVLLTWLAKLPSTRLLCISRPEANVLGVIGPNIVAKTIHQGDNAKDIESHVHKKLEEYPNLKIQFTMASQDAINYFRENGNGIFLWVELVLKQLTKAKSSSIFQQNLKGFSTASGSMENLYSTILSRIDVEYQKWVIEIIRWLVITEMPLSVRTLKQVVERCLEPDTLLEFRQFLDEYCGSIIGFLPGGGPDKADGGEIVRLVHETFRSFIVKREVCPSAFVIDEVKSHGSLALRCLECLTDGRQVDECQKYAASYWIKHLSKAISAQHAMELLMALHKFFLSKGLTRWVHALCKSLWFGNNIPSLEAIPVRTICAWLRTCSVPNTSELDEDSRSLRESVEWRSAVLSEPSIIGVAIGKAAALIWLYERLDSFLVLRTCFLLSLKYYWRRKNKTTTNLEDLNQLTSTGFDPIVAWANPGGSPRPIVQRNIGVAFYSLYKLSECIRYSLTEDNISENEDEFRQAIAYCFLAKRDYEGAIGFLEKHAMDGCLFGLFLDACVAKGKVDKAIEIFRAEVDRNSRSSALNCLYEAYAGKGDWDAIIKLFQDRSSWKEFDNEGTELQTVLKACRKTGNFTSAIAICQEFVDQNPKDYDGWSTLAKFYQASGNQSCAIEVLELGLSECRSAHLYPELMAMHIKRHDYKGAIEVAERGMEKGRMCKRTVRRLAEAYDKKGDLMGLEITLQRIAEKFPESFSLYELGRIYMRKGDYDNAVRVYTRAIERPEVPSFYLESLFTAHKKSGDYWKAIDVFKTKVKIESCNWPFWVQGLSDVYAATMDFDGAITTFEDVVNKYGTDWGWIGLLKAAAANRAKFDAIFEKFEAAVDEERVELSGWASYTVFATRGDYWLAIEKLTKIVNRVPLASWAWYSLSDAYKKAGHIEKAIEVLCSALQLIPLNYAFHKRLADLYHTISDYRQVLKCYERGVESRGPEFSFALILFSQPFTSLYDAGLKIDETFHEHFVWHTVGEAYKRLGDNSRAFELYSAAIDAYEAVTDYPTRLLWLSEQPFSAPDGEVHGPVFAMELPAEYLWTATGLAYRAKGDQKGALAVLGKAYELQPQNLFIRNLICELENEVSSTGDDRSGESTGV